MRIQGVTKVEGIMFVLDTEEARKAANGDKKILERIGKECGDMLRICGIDPETGEKTHTKGVHLLKGTEEEKKHIHAPAKKGEGVKLGNLKTTQCKWCKQLYSTRGINIHMARCPKKVAEPMIPQKPLDVKDVEGLRGTAI